jgi:hypothetical protein
MSTTLLTSWFGYSEKKPSMRRASAYIKSQAHAGWTLIRSRYDDGGYSGAGLQLEQNNTRRNGLICGGLSTALPFPCKNSDLRKLTSRHFIVVGAVACSSWPLATVPDFAPGPRRCITGGGLLCEQMPAEERVIAACLDQAKAL